MRQQVLRIFGSTLSEAKKLAADVPCERFAEQPFDGAKHPAWVIAHIALASGMVLDYLRGKAGGYGPVPEAWAEACMPGTECKGERSLYATRTS
ncbi:MAG: hypothetical protein K8E66_05815 [Phycisphaerales bacterium]|nr:hypothetical protein [Phycisphaerales bacterium]